MSKPHSLIALLLIYATLTIPAILNKDLWSPDEPRYAEVAREMHLSGDYVVTRVNNQPYKEKPPLLFWSTAAFSVVLGEVNEVAARLPSLVSGAVTLILTYLLAFQLFGARIAWWSGVILITSVRFWLQSTTGQIDMLLAACMTVSLFSFWQWKDNRHRRWLVGFYAGVALGLLAKGPPAFLFPGFLAFAFYWREKREWLRMHLPWGLLLSSLPVGLWLFVARTQAADEFGDTASNVISSNLYFQTLGRLLAGSTHAHGPLYYVYNLPVDLLPWSLFLPYVIRHVWRRRKDGPPIKLLLCWVIPALIFFTISVEKRAVYLVPLFPAFSILLSLGAVDLMDNLRSKWHAYAGYTWAGVLCIAGLAPIVVPFTDFEYGWKPSLYVVTAFGAAAAVHTLRVLQTNPKTLHRALVVHMSLLYIITTFAVFPSLNTLKSARPFCVTLQQLTRGEVNYDLYGLNLTRPEYVFYMGRFHTYLEIPLTFSEDGVLDERSKSKLFKQRERIIHDIAEVLPKTPAAPSAEEIEAFEENLSRTLHELGLESAEGCSPSCRLETQAEAQLGRLRSDTPVFVFAEEPTWRWVTAITPGLSPYHIIQLERIGSREVVLVANPAGKKLMDEQAQTPGADL